MPGAKIRLQPGVKGGLLHAFVDMKELRMSSVYADPDDARFPLRGRKCADAGPSGARR